MEKDFQSLINNMSGKNGYLEKNNEEKYKDLLSLQLVEVFNKIKGSDGVEKFNKIKEFMGHFSFDTSKNSSNNEDGKYYNNKMMWLFEMYTVDTANMKDEKSYYSSSNLNSFMNYYMGLDKDKLNEVAKALSGIKNITVTDSKLTNGMNTHFISNADFLIKAFNALKNEGWNNFNWSEGYRSFEDYKNIYGGTFNDYKTNGHANNCAIDIMINNSFKLNNLINFAIANFNNGTFDRIELKNYGFHLEEYEEGSKKTREILFGNNRGDTIEVFLKYMYEEGKISKNEYDTLMGYYKDKYYKNDEGKEVFISLTENEIKEQNGVKNKMNKILEKLKEDKGYIEYYNLYLYYLQQLYEAQMNIQSNWEQYYFGY